MWWPFRLKKQRWRQGVRVPREGSAMLRRDQGTACPSCDVCTCLAPHLKVESGDCPWPQLPPGEAPVMPAQPHGAPPSHCGPGPGGHLPSCCPCTRGLPQAPVISSQPRWGRSSLSHRGLTARQQNPRWQFFWRLRRENPGKIEIFSAES